MFVIVRCEAFHVMSCCAHLINLSFQGDKVSGKIQSTADGVSGVAPDTTFCRPPALSEMDPEYRLYKHSSAPLPFARPVHIFLGPYKAAGGRGCVLLEIQHLGPDLHETQVTIQPENTNNAQHSFLELMSLIQEGVKIIPAIAIAIDIKGEYCKDSSRRLKVVNPCHY